MVVVGGGASGRGVVVAEIKVLRIDSDQFRWISDVYLMNIVISNQYRIISQLSNKENNQVFEIYSIQSSFLPNYTW